MTTERQLFEDATYNEDRMTAWEVWQASATVDRSGKTEHQIIAEFLERTDQYVTNDASREAAIAQDVEKERVGCFLAVEEMLQRFAEDGRIKPLDAMKLLREIKERVQFATTMKKETS